MKKSGASKRQLVITSEETLYGQEDGSNVVQRRPFLFENVQTNVATSVHVWVITRRLKLHRRRFVWIATRKFQNQFVREAVIYLTHVNCVCAFQ